MSLVAYGSSSESEESDNESVPQKQQTLQSKRNLSSLLPPPKKTVYVELPKLKDEDEEEERQPKRTKITSGLGLADLLPAPKNYKSPVPVTKSTTDKSFMPHALARKLKEKGKGKTTADIEEEASEIKDIIEGPAVVEKEEAEEAEEAQYIPKKHTGPFFHIGKALKEEPVIKPAPKPVQPTPGPAYTVERAPQPEEPQMAAVDAYAYDPNAMYSADPAAYYQYQQQQQQAYTEMGNIEEEQELERIVGKKLRGESGIQIKTVNQRDILPSEEWRAAQALTAAPKFNDGITMQASKQQIKKNNIMALAAHAVNNQEKMDEMFAAHKKTRREAAKKYGF